MSKTQPQTSRDQKIRAPKRPGRLRRFFIITGSIVGGLVLVIAGLGFWFLYTPSAPEPELAAKVSTESVTVDGLERTFVTVIPDDLPADAPVVFAFHGSNMDGETLRGVTGYRFDELAVERGYLMVYPDGYQKTWYDCRTGTSYPARLEKINDLGFVEAMITSLHAEYGSSSERILATGLSNGGHFSYRLAAERPDLVTAIAPFAAAYPAPSNDGCSYAGEPVPTMITLGTADPISPFNGGEAGFMGSSLGDVLPARQVASFLAERAGITSEPTTTAFSNTNADGETDVTQITYGEQTDTPVVLYTVDGGGHVVPNPVYAQPRIMGGTTKFLDGPLQAIDFFESLE